MNKHLQRYLPEYDIRASYKSSLLAPIEDAYAAVRTMDMKDSWMVRSLYRLRGLPASGLKLEGMLDWGFVLLADEPPREIVFGLIGRFWTHKPQILRIDAESFAAFDEPGYAKAAGNIAFEEAANGAVTA